MARKLRLEFPGAFYHVINAPRAHKPWQLPNVDLCGRSHASNRWLTEHLQMGTPVAVSQYVSAFRHHRSSDPCSIQQLTEKPKA